MSIGVKVYNKISPEDVRQGMTLRIVTEGPGIKSDVEGTVDSINQAWLSQCGSVIPGHGRVTFRGDPTIPHVIKYHDNVKVMTELYEVIDAIPEEPKGVGAVVRIVNLTHPDRDLVAVKAGPETSGVWIGNGVGVSWESISECVLSQGYDYIKVLSEGVEL